ncbi:MAG: ammonium transporter [Chthoniobacterales bacterium]
MTPIDQLWILASATLVMTMQIGFCMLEAGLVRSKNSINVAIKNLIDFCVAAILFWACGYAIMFGLSPSGWFGIRDFFVGDSLGPDALMHFIFQLMFCATAATIVSGAVAERLSFSSYIIIAAIVSGFLYPISGGWAWNENGWLAQMGFRDFAGSTVVHSLGGWASLAAIVILGPRIGRFGSATPLVSSHSLVSSTIGVIILFVGWLGFNGGSTLAFNGTVPLIIVNTTLAGAAGCLVGLSTVWARTRVPQLPPTLNGCLGGLVAITANCHAVSAPEALLIGGIGGALSYVGLIILEALRIDDVVGASAAHSLPGVWGTLAVGLLGDLTVLDTGLSRGAQIGVQALGCAVFFVWAFGGAWLLLTAVNFVRPLRISKDVEMVGLNVSEHGASTEIIDLLNEMSRHSEDGQFNERLDFEPFSEVGQIASEYNRVIDKVISEMEFREGITRRLQRSRDESESANRKIFSSLQYARRIQQAILPEPRTLRDVLGDHFLIYQPRDLVAGDFYWCQQVGDSGYCAIVDCTGHGVPGAFMSMIGSLLLEHIIVEKRLTEPAEILAEMHRRVRRALAQDSPEGAANRDGMEVALIRIDSDKVVFAGANRPLWWFQPDSAGHREFGEILGDLHGLGGGALEPKEIRFTQHTLPLDPALAIYLQTDGFVQQPNHLRSIYDHGRLRDLLRSIQDQPPTTQSRRVSESFKNFRGGASQRDDFTILGIQFSTSEDTDRTPSLASEQPAMITDPPSRDQPFTPQLPGTLFHSDGTITPSVIEACGRILRERTQLSIAGRIALFGAFVELAQNVARHSADRDPETDIGRGTLTVLLGPAGFELRSTNQISPADHRHLRSRLDELVGLSREELNQLYLTRLHEPKNSALSAGLGLIDLARKSAKPPTFDLPASPENGNVFSLSLHLDSHLSTAY